MKITIVTLYRDSDGSTFVGAVKGELSDKEKKGFRNGFKVPKVEAVDTDALGFCVFELAETVADLHETLDAFPD